VRRASFTGTKFGGGGKRGRAKIPSPQPPSFLPARAFGLAREARRQFRSKKVRISSNKRTKKSNGAGAKGRRFNPYCPPNLTGQVAKVAGSRPASPTII